MSTADKLRLMEALWKDLSEHDSEIASPKWHGDVLAEREKRLASGEDVVVDWNVAKQKLREELL